MPKRWREALFDDRSRHLDRFGLLLAVTAVAVVALSLVDLTARPGDLAAEFGSLAATILVGTAFLLALRASGFARRWQRVADILVGVAILVIVCLLVLYEVMEPELSAYDSAYGSVEATRPLVVVTLSVLAPVVVVRRLTRHRRVSGGTLLGAISAYLLVPVAFYYAFLTIDTYQATPFFGQPEPTTSFMYFSLTTITTLGYGDLAAVTPLGRVLAVTEAVVGQVYLVTVVAMLVGLLAQRWPNDDTDELV